MATQAGDSEELVSASELAEFVYCRRGWALSKQGMRLSAAVAERREVGNRFHDARTAEVPASPVVFRRWAVVLALIAVLCIVLALVWR